jgi:rubrerythrin
MKKLNEMIRDEKKAPKDYYQLLKEIKRGKDKTIIRGIIRQERRHLRKLKRIRSRYRY